jgi:hypothetical protein
LIKTSAQGFFGHFSPAMNAEGVDLIVTRERGVSARASA